MLEERNHDLDDVRTARVHRREDHGREKDTVLHRQRRHSWASAIFLDDIVTSDILCTNPNGQEQRKALRAKSQTVMASGAPQFATILSTSVPLLPNVNGLQAVVPVGLT